MKLYTEEQVDALLHSLADVIEKRDLSLIPKEPKPIEITEDEIMGVIKSHELIRTDGVHIVMINGVFPEVYKSLATAITNLLKG